MGWWGADVRGGDSALDGIGALEEVVGWDYEKRGHFIYQPEAAEEARKVLSTRAAQTQVKILVTKLSLKDYSLRDGSIIGIASVLVDLGVKILPEVVKIIRRAIEVDEFGAESRERSSILHDFALRLNMATGEKVQTRTYRVTVTREAVSTAEFEVKGISHWEARKLAEKMARDHDFGSGSSAKYHVDHVQEFPA